MAEIIIFGSGISSATIARKLAEDGHKITVYEKMDRIGGNCYDYVDAHGVLVHKYGPHIFHTSNEEVYQFITRFDKLNGFINTVKVSVNDLLFPLPINYESIATISKLDAEHIINVLKEKFVDRATITLYEMKAVEDAKVSKCAEYIWNNVFANYTSKMWGMPIQQVDSSIINRIKVVLGNGESYFPEDKYQGLPTKGYTNLIKSMFDHENIKVVLNSHSKDILSIDGSLQINGKKFEGNVIYCGLIDELFDYKFGELEFRSLDIKFESHNVDKFQNVAVINYPADPKMTRICEYKNMTFQSVHDWTTISKEFPGNYDKNSSSFSTPFYPVTSNKNNLSLYELYLQETKKYNNLHLLGRLSQYKYYDMDDAISAAFELYKKIK